MVPHGDRSGVVIEPFLTDQWYVNAKSAGRAGDRGGARRAHRVRAEELGEDLLRVDGEHPALVHLAPALVGPSDPGLVRARTARCSSPRPKRRRSSRALAYYAETEAITPMQGHDMALDPDSRRAVPDARRGRARHLVLLGAVAVLDAGLAGRDAGARALLSDRRAGHRLRHHLLLGRPDDDDGPALHGRGAVPHRLHPRAGARRARRQDVEVQGQRHRPARADRRVRRRRAALHAGRHGGAGPRHQARQARVEGYRNFATKLWNAAASPR